MVCVSSLIMVQLNGLCFQNKKYLILIKKFAF